MSSTYQGRPMLRVNLTEYAAAVMDGSRPVAEVDFCGPTHAHVASRQRCAKAS